MKIVFVLRSLEYGGAERQLIMLARGLRERGHKVRVVTYYSGGPLLQEMRDSGIEPISLEKKGRWDIFGFLGRLLRLIRRERPDILHSYLTSSNVLATIIKPLLPPLKLVWGVRAADMPTENYDWMQRLFTRLESWLSRYADRILINSQAGMAHAVAIGFAREHMQVIANGIDTGRFRPDASTRLATRATLGLAEDSIAVGMVARLDPVKDYETFLAAAALLRDGDMRWRFFCVGDGEPAYTQSLVQAGQPLGNRVTWLGARRDVPALYTAFDVACLPSFSEGFPNTVAEAMSTGLACAVTDVGDSKLIVNDPALVVRRRDKQALAAAIEYGWKTRHAAAQRREYIVMQFGVNALIDTTEAALKDLL